MITGPDRPFLGALIFPPKPQLAADPNWRSELAGLLTSFAAKATGSSNRILRVLPVEDLPSMENGELTDKGSLNQRALLKNRIDLIEELYKGSERTIEAKVRP